MKRSVFFLSIIFAGACVFSQTKDAYDQSADKQEGALDASKFSIHHSLSFGMGTSMGSSMQSQGLYSTMLTYSFSQPVTLNLNFGFPLFSSFSPYQNLTQQNLTSAQYFRNMPIDVSLSWKPSANMLFQLNVVRNPQYDYFSGMSYPFFYRSMFDRSLESSSKGN
jgi:hypothetical protein